MNKGGAQKFIIKDLHLLIEKYIDSIKYATNISNLSTKLRPILSREFQFHIHGELGEMSGKKNEFSRFIFPRQNIYEPEPNIKFKSPNEVIIKFYNKNNITTQYLYLEDFKINSITEKTSKKIQRAGQGYTVSVGKNPVGGQPVINGYYDCCRPIFLGSLMNGGDKTTQNKTKNQNKQNKTKKQQKGGKANSGYYLDIKNNHLVVQPQYRAYYNTLLPYTQK